MPPIDRPPMSPSVQAQMGPPGGPNFGPGIGQAQDQMGQSEVSVAVSTVEKILMGVKNDAFRTYAQRAVAILKVGEGMANRQGPQSQPGMGQPPSAGMAGAPAGGPVPQLPPAAGSMPG